jgi:hypothetical protein
MLAGLISAEYMKLIGIAYSPMTHPGHSANQIRRKAPANLKKVDYYPYSELAYQVLDARILDSLAVNLLISAHSRLSPDSLAEFI